MPQGARVDNVLSADAANHQIISRNPDYLPSYMPGTQIVEFTNTKTERFVRVSGGNSPTASNWIMRQSDIEGLSAEQIASKFALPAVPTHVGPVSVPAGTRLQGSVANGIMLGDNPGGGGVQFYIPIDRDKLPLNWFGSTGLLP
ncbi:hypothetical protein [Nitrincola sp. A-D6]|uniref:hypothetical protein n=1 Tax=Nitrincola sp. A-D6 TaxID=1545442 RepID=UPI0011863E17|nr:hypothetical protein [Nitrincola sp. A-D6]